MIKKSGINRLDGATCCKIPVAEI